VPPRWFSFEFIGSLGTHRIVLSPLVPRCPVPIPVPKKAGTSAGLRLIVKARGFRVNLKLPGIVANHADLAVGEPAWRFGLDLERELDPCALGTLKLHHDRIEDRIERLHWANYVDFDRTIEPSRIAPFCPGFTPSSSTTRGHRQSYDELRAACEGNDRHRVGQSAFWN
jgi:hypothetical protein